eukprot:TRINITY_DN3633_c0_g1_i1.p1 TRINITY_DN3633_c0_g1~~TRINITY_DN3633_c0_g1_i1.p1  ORF type:complete len:547 (-),score=149.62 TRINITY_DN3633_c0_g1_i1:823-2373(-)
MNSGLAQLMQMMPIRMVSQIQLLPKAEISKLGDSAFIVDNIANPDSDRNEETWKFGDRTHPDFKKHPNLQEAQIKLCEAYQLPRNAHEQRVKIAKRVLESAPLAADAYCLLAEHQAETLKEAYTFYRKGEEVGKKAVADPNYERRIGDHSHNEKPGWLQYWDGSYLTRPFMRAKAGAALCLLKMGDYSDARQEFHLLCDHINPGDNQGMRIPYLLCCMELGPNYYREARYVIKSRPIPMSVNTFTLALIDRIEGERSAEKNLKEALAQNKYVLPLLQSSERGVVPPISWELRGETEAQFYVYFFGKFWKKEHIEWATSVAGGKTVEANVVDKKQETKEMWEKAKSEFLKENWLEAVRALDKVTENLSKDNDIRHSALLMKGKALLRLDKHNESAENLLEYLRIKPTDISAFSELAVCFYDGSKYAPAYWTAKHSLKISKDQNYISKMKKLIEVIKENVPEEKLKLCGVCNKLSSDGKNKVCGGCKQIYFCGKSCQTTSWSSHKAYCKSPNDQPTEC